MWTNAAHNWISQGARAPTSKREWIEAWKAHDLERILAHYRQDVRFVSPPAARAGTWAVTAP